MSRTILLSIALVAAALSSGCSMVAPKYSPSLENVQKLKDSGAQTASVGTFESTPGKGNAKSISIRGSSLSSPYDGSYANYLAEALKQELSMSGKLAADAQVQVSGALQKNDINAAVGTASGDMEARFVVKRGGEVRYDQVKSIHDEWDSSFMGNIAIPRAQQRYPVMVQKLLAALYADPAFLQALK
ncbi:MAG TPA: hypothetical protein VH814_24785 [Steroidobacteraceae bacterium]